MKWNRDDVDKYKASEESIENISAFIDKKQAAVETAPVGLEDPIQTFVQTF